METPSSIRIFGDSGELHQVPNGSYKKEPSKDVSKFACSDTFRIFSKKGAAELRRIGNALKVKLSEQFPSISNIFQQFPNISQQFPNISQQFPNISQQFPNIFQQFPKISKNSICQHFLNLFCRHFKQLDPEVIGYVAEFGNTIYYFFLSVFCSKFYFCLIFFIITSWPLFQTLLRSVWYLSPFLRDFMSSKKFLNHVSNMFGEPVVPLMTPFCWEHIFLHQNFFTPKIFYTKIFLRQNCFTPIFFTPKNFFYAKNFSVK